MANLEEALSHEKFMRSTFEASLPDRLRRASRVKLQYFIPAHWFATAASECAGMYIAGFFYGAISIAQAYVEALTLFLEEANCTKQQSQPKERCEYLHREKIISTNALNAALEILNGRNDYYHLNKDVEQDYKKLEARAENCINHLHTIESEVFAFSIGEEPGAVVPVKPKYWPSGGPGLVQVNLRQLR